MKKEQLKNKKGELMTTKEDKPMYEYKLEDGDEFVPEFNSVTETIKEVTVKDELKKISNFSIKAKVRDKDKNLIENGESIFITLTPTQAKHLNNFKEKGIELNQTLFKAYQYQNEFGNNIGVGDGNFKEAKTFEQFDSEK